jgi:hypothetical protein
LISRASRIAVAGLRACKTLSLIRARFQPCSSTPRRRRSAITRVSGTFNAPAEISARYLIVVSQIIEVRPICRRCQFLTNFAFAESLVNSSHFTHCKASAAKGVRVTCASGVGETRLSSAFIFTLCGTDQAFLRELWLGGRIGTLAWVKKIDSEVFRRGQRSRGQWCIRSFSTSLTNASVSCPQ